MKTLYPPSPEEIDRMSTEDLRRNFLLEDLFLPGEVRLVNTGLERLIVGGIVPQGTGAVLEDCSELDARFFHQRRESGVINIGDAGEVIVDGESYPLREMECLYIGRGAEQVDFRSCPGGQAAFYLASSPAHAGYKTQRVEGQALEVAQAGVAEHASRRTIHRCIHEDGVPSCQLVMGWTALDSGSVWNTWPPHTHPRRSEIYLYTGLGDHPLMHFLGTPDRTRHLVVRDRQAALSPPWSIHCGAGTVPYRFIWAMAGENRAYGDMNPVDLGALR